MPPSPRSRKSFASAPTRRSTLAASVLLDELAEHPETTYVALARCARAAAEGQIARAKQLFDGLPAPAAGDPDQAFLHGEIALRAGDPKAAAAAWQQARACPKEPAQRVRFGARQLRRG